MTTPHADPLADWRHTLVTAETERDLVTLLAMEADTRRYLDTLRMHYSEVVEAKARNAIAVLVAGLAVLVDDIATAVNRVGRPNWQPRRPETPEDVLIREHIHDAIARLRQSPEEITH